MNWTKKLAAVGLAAMMVVGAAACNTGASTNWIAKMGEETVPAGVYLTILLNQYSEQVAKLPVDEEGNAPKKPLNESLDGKKVHDLIVEESRKQLNEYLAAETKFAELGLEMNAEEVAMVDQQNEMYWSFLQDLYKENGISQQSYNLIGYNSIKRDALFMSIYGEGGSEPVPAEEITEKFYTDYAKILMIPLALADETDEEKESKDKTTREKIDEYYAQLEGGADMENVIFQARKDTAEDPDSVSQAERGKSFTFVNRDQSSYEPNVTEAIFSAEIGKPVKVEDQYNAYLFVKYDIKETPDDVNQFKNSIIRALRQDAFAAQLTEWAGQIPNLTINEAALQRYVPSKLKVM